MQTRIGREKKTIDAMIRIYCREVHGHSPGDCADCGEMLEYAHQRLDDCPYGERKPTCKECTIHCYKPAMRKEIQTVMKYAGPRMLLKHPYLAIAHLWDERKTKSKRELKITAITEITGRRPAGTGKPG